MVILSLIILVLEGVIIKTKVFVFSSSGLDYLPHGSQISAIPDIIKSFYGEIYYDSIELDTIQFYDRARFDKYFLPEYESTSVEKIEEYIDNAISNKYERFIFLVNYNDVMDYTGVLNEVITKYDKYEIYLLKINALAYPLAQLAIDVEKIIRSTDNIDEVIDYVNKYQESFKIFFYSPKENILPSIKRIDFDDDVISSSNNGKLMMYDGNLVDVKRNIQDSYIQRMLDSYLKEIEGEKVFPFILYTNKDSIYNDILERKLMNIFPRIKNIKKFPVPVALGIKVGYNTVGLGFVKKIDE